LEKSVSGLPGDTHADMPRSKKGDSKRNKKKVTRRSGDKRESRQEEAVTEETARDQKLKGGGSQIRADSRRGRGSATKKAGARSRNENALERSRKKYLGIPDSRGKNDPRTD